MPLRYRVFVSEQVLLLLPTLSRKTRVLLLRFIREAGEHPHRGGDYREPDDAGRQIEVSVVEDHAILFWADHAAAEVKVIELRRAD